jgi:putative Mg2+ transporter-C (MgtC) family protein
MLITQEEIFKLLLALLIGGIIGFEREIKSKSAGLRTITLITVGATLFTMLSVRFGGGSDRVAANIVTGIGFLGAGAILLSEGRIKGLTTASSIWVASALGMAIGLGEFWLAGASALVVFMVLWLFVPFDRMIDSLGREIREYDIIYLARENKTEEVEQLIKGFQLKILRKRKMKSEDRLIGEYEVRGMHKNHNQLVEKLLEDKEIYEVKY